MLELLCSTGWFLSSPREKADGLEQAALNSWPRCSDAREAATGSWPKCSDAGEAALGSRARCYDAA